MALCLNAVVYILIATSDFPSLRSSTVDELEKLPFFNVMYCCEPSVAIGRLTAAVGRSLL